MYIESPKAEDLRSKQLNNYLHTAGCPLPQKGTAGAPGGVGFGAAGAAGVTPSSGGATSQVDPLVLVYLYLMDAAMNSAENANLKAKELDVNAVDQEQLNRQVSALKMQHVPTVQRSAPKDNKTYTFTQRFLNQPPTRHTHDHWIPGQILNMPQIEAAESQNQAVVQNRSILEDRLTVLQQVSSVGQTSVSTGAQISLRTYNEGDRLMTLIETLTYKALQKQQPDV